MSDSLVFKLNDDNSLMLRDHTEKIINSLQSISKEFLKVGYLLWEVNKYKWYELAGYESIIEYSNNELSLRKSQTYNFINVIERFGLVENGSKKYMKLKEGFEDYNFSQLCEMLPIDDDKIKLINPDMSCKAIRELKKTLEENERIEIINDKIENKEIQVLEGQKSIFDEEKEEIKEVQTTGIEGNEIKIKSMTPYERRKEFEDNNLNYVLKTDMDIQLRDKASQIEELKMQLEIREKELENMENSIKELSEKESIPDEKQFLIFKVFDYFINNAYGKDMDNVMKECLKSNNKYPFRDLKGFENYIIDFTVDLRTKITKKDN